MSKKLRFAGKKTEVIKIDDDEVVVKASLPFSEFREIMAATGYGTGDNLAGALALIKKVIVSWSFTDEDGAAVPPTSENIDLLDSMTVLQLMEKLLPLFTPEKKS